MRLLMAVLAVMLCASQVIAADALAEARRLYNLGQYDAAAKYAREALKVPATAESGRLVLGRIQLELYRRSADNNDLDQAREALRAVSIAALEPGERAELTIGIGESLFLEGKYGIASESFERALDISASLGLVAHERVLDWWATSLDRLALTRPREAREPFYARIIQRMERELLQDPMSAPAAYWLVAGLRGTGNLERAWFAAGAGWVNASLSRDRGAALRADLDRLVVQGIIPERAVHLEPKDPKLATGIMLGEWEALKAAWSK